MARACTSGPRDLLRNGFVRGDPSLRLKNGSVRDDHNREIQINRNPTSSIFCETWDAQSRNMSTKIPFSNCR